MDEALKELEGKVMFIQVPSGTSKLAVQAILRNLMNLKLPCKIVVVPEKVQVMSEKQVKKMIDDVYRLLEKDGTNK